MPRLLEPHSRTEAVLHGARRVIAERGLTGFTLRAIAAESGISPSALSHQFTDRDRLVRTVVALLGRDRSADIGRRSWREGALAFLPTEGHLMDARVWLACCELGRSEHQVGEVVARVRQDERELLDALTDHVLDATGLDVLAAVVEGLVAAVCAPEQPLALARARAALHSACPPPCS